MPITFGVIIVYRNLTFYGTVPKCRQYRLTTNVDVRVCFVFQCRHIATAFPNKQTTQCLWHQKSVYNPMPTNTPILKGNERQHT